MSNVNIKTPKYDCSHNVPTRIGTVVVRVRLSEVDNNEPNL